MGSSNPVAMRHIVRGLMLAVMLSSPAAAFRCGGDLIVNGDRKVQVLAACGEPDWVETPGSVVVNRVGIFWTLDVDEEWIYNFGPQEFIRMVRFRAGRVVDTDVGGYGWVRREREHQRGLDKEEP